MQASVPELGGTIEIGPFLPVRETLIANFPLPDFLIWADFTGP